MSGQPAGRSLPDVAAHEASHAVVWWWWVERPEGKDDGTGGYFDLATIEAHPTLGRGRFESGLVPVIEAVGGYLEHVVTCALAGPISDHLRGLAPVPNIESTYDYALARTEWEAAVRGGYVADDTWPGWQERGDKLARGFLADAVVQRVIERITAALLRTTTLTGDQAVPLMREVVGC